MRPAGLEAFSKKRENRSGIYSYEQRPGELPGAIPERARRPSARRRVPCGAAAVVSQADDVVDRQREEGGDPPVPAGQAGRGLPCRQASLSRRRPPTTGWPRRCVDSGRWGCSRSSSSCSATPSSSPLSAILALVTRLARVPLPSWASCPSLGADRSARVFGAALKLFMKSVVMPLFGADPVNRVPLPGRQYCRLAVGLYAVTVGAGFGEETIFRGFAFEGCPAARHERGRHCRHRRFTSVWFGAEHYSLQGLAGVQQATVSAWSSAPLRHDAPPADADRRARRVRHHGGGADLLGAGDRRPGRSFVRVSSAEGGQGGFQTWSGTDPGREQPQKFRERREHFPAFPSPPRRTPSDQGANDGIRFALRPTEPLEVDMVRRSIRATAEEKRQTLPGDDLIPRPTASLTQAITLHCTADRIWPWLAQMGAGRAGWSTATTRSTTAASRAPSASCRSCRPSRLATCFRGCHTPSKDSSSSPARSSISWVLVAPADGHAIVTRSFVLEPARTARPA